MVTHIVAAVDGSPGSRRAALFARDLAGQTGARLTLLVVIRPPSAVALPPFDSFSLSSSAPDPEHLAATRAIFDEIEAGLPKGQATARSALGADAAEVICSEARAVGADLLVVGARGLGAAERFFVGSVSEKVIRESAVPVTVVH